MEIMANMMKPAEERGTYRFITITMEEVHYLEEFTMAHHGIEDHGFIVEEVGE